MMKVTVLQGQSLLDIAVQACGSVEAAFDIAIRNKMSITDQPGSALFAPAIVDKRIWVYYNERTIAPATWVSDMEVEAATEGGEGIEFWAIEYDFIIS